jgi:hypothetical protein
MDGWHRATLHNVPQCLALATVDDVGVPGALPFKRPRGPSALKRSAIAIRYRQFAPRPSASRRINLRKRQKTAGLIGITRGASLRTKAASKSGQKQNWSRHGKLLIAHVSQTQRLRLGPFGHQTAVQELSNGPLDDLFDFLRRWRLAQTNEALQPHGS